MPRIIASLVASCAIAFGGGSFFHSACAQSIGATTPQTSGEVSENGSDFVEKLLRRATSLGAYKVTADLAMLKKGKPSKTVAQFSYKSPNQLRIDVLSGGMNTGAAVAERADGSVVAKGGPALLGLKMNLEKNSRMLRLPNGLMVTSCDFASLVRMLKDQERAGSALSVSSGPIKIDDVNAIVVELHGKGDTSSIVAQRVLVDPSHMLPVEWILFKDGALLSTTKFKNLELSPQLDDSIFHL